MSYMTTNMFAPHIWGFDLRSTQVQIARQAGWSHADILWEGLMEAGNTAWIESDRKAAPKQFRRAYWVANLAFPRSDLRHATVRINLGIMAAEVGRNRKAASYFNTAISHWDTYAKTRIAAMNIAPRARSSLFHLRMEALHRNTYHDNLRMRISKICAETREAVGNLKAGRAAGCRLFTRWLGERPSIYDDTRKILGASLLVVEIQSVSDRPIQHDS